MKIEYFKHSQLAKLNKDDFSTLAYVTEDRIQGAFNGMGFSRSWIKKDDAIYDTVLELVEAALEDLRENPKKKSTYCATGKLRVELDIYDYDGDGEDEIVPSISIEIWD